MREPTYPKEREIELSQVLYALSDPVRLRIVRILWDEEERTCGTFPIDMPKSTLSHHFKVLRECGLTMTRSEGTSRIISLRRKELGRRFPGVLTAILRVAHRK